MTKSVAFYTLGCKVNQYETGRMEQQFREAGYEVLDPTRFASVYVINTCTVTRLAERKSRQFLRRARRQNPDAILAVVGCYPTVNPDEVRGIGDIDIVLDNDRKEQIVECVEVCAEERSAQRIRSSCEDNGSFDAVTSPGGLSGQRTRATIKIQDGCDRFCTYCVIPYARGHIRSRPLEDIVTESERLIEGGARELVLAGINTALYGAERGSESDGVIDIVRAIGRLPGDFRIRLGSLEPTVVDAAYVERLLACEKLCHHLHLSLQSGSDRILRAMHRRYSVEDYMDIVRVVRNADPHYAITTDIIAGFPGETDEDFRASLDVIRAAGFLKVHAFPYSRRPLTEAADMGDQIATAVKKERIRQLNDVSDAVAFEYLSGLRGRQLRVLPEETVSGEPGQAMWKGRADRYVMVYVPAKEGMLPEGGFQTVTAGRPYGDGLAAAEEEQGDRMYIL